MPGAQINYVSTDVASAPLIRLRTPMAAQVGSSVTPARQLQHFPAYPHALTLAQRAILTSHRRAWQHMVGENLPFALIVEEDMRIDQAKFTSAVTFATERIATLGIIQITSASRRCDDVLERRDGLTLARPKDLHRANVAQMVSNAAARKLLQVTAGFDRPLEAMLSMFWITGIYPHVMSGAGILPHRRTLVQYAVQCIRRCGDQLNLGGPQAAYRRRMRALSQLHRQWALP